MLRLAPPRCGPASDSEAWGCVLSCLWLARRAPLGGWVTCGRRRRVSTEWARRRPSPGVPWWGRRCPPGSRGPVGPGTCGSVSSARTARARRPGTCGRWSARRSRPHGRTGTARSARERGEERLGSGLAWDSTPHPTPGPSVLDKTVTAWRGSQRLEPQQAGRVGETTFFCTICKHGSQGRQDSGLGVFRVLGRFGQAGTRGPAVGGATEGETCLVLRAAVGHSPRRGETVTPSTRSQP